MYVAGLEFVSCIFFLQCEVVWDMFVFAEAEARCFVLGQRVYSEKEPPAIAVALKD
jgi:hypothetical protein